MSFLRSLSPFKTLVLVGSAVLIFIVVGIGFVLKVTVDRLLYSDATAAAESWAKFVAENVSDLEEIADGAQPSAESMTFFIRTQQIRNVFGFQIANLYGNVQLSSDGSKISSPRGTVHDETAARAARSRRPIISVKEGIPPFRPLHYSEAYLPVMIDGKPRAVVAAYVDLTEQYKFFRNEFLIAAVFVCLLTGFGVAIPTIAWHRQTKEKQQADRRIRFLAQHDPLTSLMNRASLVERLDVALRALPPEGVGLALHFVDIDHFKSINDVFGHETGDYVLRTIAERLLALTRHDDAIGRFGGDEFVIIQTNIDSKEDVDLFAKRLRASVAEPIRFKDQDIVTTTSVGIALAPSDGHSSERLLKSADLAADKSKADGRNCIRFFSPDMDAELSARIELEKRIREAIAADRFVLHFQPMFEIEQRRLIGFEALVRLPAEDGSLISPVEFIPIVEEMHLIDKLGTWVMREACRNAAAWPNDLLVAVNLSPAQFATGSISEMVADALKVSGLPARQLEVEITENLLLDDSESAMAELRRLKALGVAIVMDDFGTGYSSLSYLWRFPFDKIKIDRGFMLGLDRPGRDAETVVKTIIALGRELHMRVTVEGVETARQASFLEAIPGDQVQGFFFGRPVPASQITPDTIARLQQLGTPKKATAETGS